MNNKNIITITKRADFLYIKKYGKKIRSHLLNIIYVKSQIKNNNTSVAYVASKKLVGNAVKRNKVKRRLRNLVRENSKIIPNNYFIIFIALSKSYSADYILLRNDFLFCINKIHC